MRGVVKQQRTFASTLPLGYDVIPVDALKRELQALHGRARKAQAEEVMAGASKLVAEINEGRSVGGSGPITLEEFRVIMNRQGDRLCCIRAVTYLRARLGA